MLTAITVLSFGLLLFGPIWTTIRFDDAFGRFLWMQRAFDEPHYFRQLYLQIADGALDVNYRFFSKLLGAVLLWMGASFDQMVTVYAIVNPVLVFTGALLLAGVWEKRSIGRVIWALLLVLSFDLLSGSNAIVDNEPPAWTLASMIGDPALLKMDGVNFFMIHRRPEPQSSWIVLFPYFAALLGSFLSGRRGPYIGVCVVTPFLALIYINVAVVALLVFVQMSVLGIVVYRRPIGLPFGLSVLAALVVWGVTLKAGSTSVVAAQSILHTHLPILRPSVAMAVAGLIWAGLALRRDGARPAPLAALVFFAVPLITLDQQIVTGRTVMPQNWEFDINYICLIVGAGVMSGNFLSSFSEYRDWRRLIPLALWLLTGFVVVRGELRNEAQYTVDNARSVVFAEVLAKATSRGDRIDAVVLPHLFDESLFVTRTPPGTMVLGGYTSIILNSPPPWPDKETFAEHAAAASASFAAGFETLFRSGVMPEQFRSSMQAEIDAGNCWPSLMYFFSLNDCWPAFLNYTSPATPRLASAIPALVALYANYLDKDAAAALAGKQVLLIRAEPLQRQSSPAIDNELVASAEIELRGTPVRAYAYLQRRRRP